MNLLYALLVFVSGCYLGYMLGLRHFRKLVRKTEGGIWKRADENRELYSLLEREAPDWLASHSWVSSWFTSHDRFYHTIGTKIGVPRRNQVREHVLLDEPRAPGIHR